MEFTEPDPRLQTSFLQAWEEFAHDESCGGEPQAANWMGAFRWGREKCEDPDRFAAMCAARRTEKTEPAEGFVPAAMLWAVQGDQWLGRVSVRHELNDFLRDRGGHIGYAVRPSARRRGIATALLRAGLEHLHGLGVESALVTCDDDNVGSYSVIERCGGVLEDVREGTRRYWVPTA